MPYSDLKEKGRGPRINPSIINIHTRRLLLADHTFFRAEEIPIKSSERTLIITEQNIIFDKRTSITETYSLFIKSLSSSISSCEMPSLSQRVLTRAGREVPENFLRKLSSSILIYSASVMTTK